MGGGVLIRVRLEGFHIKASAALGLGFRVKGLRLQGFKGLRGVGLRV